MSQYPEPPAGGRPDDDETRPLDTGGPGEEPSQQTGPTPQPQPEPPPDEPFSPPTAPDASPPTAPYGVPPPPASPYGAPPPPAPPYGAAPPPASPYGAPPPYGASQGPPYGAPQAPPYGATAGYPNAPYGAPPYGTPYAPPMTPEQSSLRNQAIGALVANIVATLFCCVITGIGGAICAGIAIGRVSSDAESARRLLKWSWGLLIGGVVVGVLLIIGFIALVASSNSGSGI